MLLIRNTCICRTLVDARSACFRIKTKKSFKVFSESPFTSSLLFVSLKKTKNKNKQTKQNKTKNHQNKTEEFLEENYVHLGQPKAFNLFLFWKANVYPEPSPQVWWLLTCIGLLRGGRPHHARLSCFLCWACRRSVFLVKIWVFLAGVRLEKLWKGGGLFCSSFLLMLFSTHGFSQVKIEKSKRDFFLICPQYLTASGPDEVGSEH